MNETNQQQDDDFSKLPLQERLVHKSWKARQGAYEELNKKFKSLEETSQEFLKFADSLKGMLTDSNQVAQETGFTTVNSFLMNAPSSVCLKGIRSTLVPLAVEKGFTANRQGTKTAALELLLLYIELDSSDIVIDAMIQGLDHKTSKCVIVAVHGLKEAVRLFGASVVNLKPILKQLPKMFDHKDSNVRQQATELVLEMYRWMGPALCSCLDGLKPIQIKELNDLFQNVEQGSSKPLRLTRSAQKQKLSTQEELSTMGKSLTSETLVADLEQEPEVDPLSFIDPVNILDKLPKDFYENLTSSKWKERKESLEFLLNLLEAPKLEDGRYNELLGSLAKRMNDANVLVVTLSANCIDKIAKGLGKSFATYRNLVLSPLIERLKENKTNVVNAISNALDSVFKTLSSINDIVEDVVNFVSNKNPQVRLEVIKFLTRALNASRKPLGKSETKSIATAILKTMDDSVDSIREVSAQAFALLMKTLGEKAMIPYIEKLDKIKEAKIRDFYVQCSADTSPVTSNSVTSAAAVTAPPRTNSVATKINIKPIKKPSTKKSAPLSKASSKTAEVEKKMSPQAPVVYRYTDDSAIDVVNEILPGIQERLSDTVWKTRLSAMQELTEKLKSDMKNLPAEALIRFLGKFPGWKESNFQISINMVNIVGSLALESDTFDVASSNLIVPALCEKLGDAKVKKVASTVLFTIAEKQSLQIVLSSAYPALESFKSPKAISDAIIWLQQCIMEFGIAGVKQELLIDFLKKSLSNPNQSVRSAAVSAFGSLHMFSKSGLHRFVQDLSPQILQLLEAEFEKVSAIPKPQPNRIQSNVTKTNSSDICDERSDILPLLTSDLMNNLGNTNWKLRKEGLDELHKILKNTGLNIQSNIGSDLIPVLKARLSDSNKNLVMQTCEICGDLAKSMGTGFAKTSKILLSHLISVLTDPKPQVRSSSLDALEKVSDAIGINAIVSSLGSSLMQDHPQLRKDLLVWMTDKFSKTNNIEVDFTSLVHPVLLCLQDRNIEVRKQAQILLGILVASLGSSFITEKASEHFHGTALSSLSPFLDSLQPNIASASASKSSASEPSQKTIGKLNKTKPKVSRQVLETAKKEALEIPLVPSAGFPIFPSDFKAKEQRSIADKGLQKWAFESPRKELIDILSDQCYLVFAPELHRQLFSEDHYREREYLAGLSVLHELLSNRSKDIDGIQPSDINQRFLSISDLILKYTTIRFFDSNTSMFIKVLDILEKMFQMMDDEGYLLTDYEASSFLPFFINKMGDSKESMRIKIRSIMKQICRLYPASKLFTFVLKGLDSKNARTRAECLDELSILIQRNSLSVCAPIKVFPFIANQITDRDATVRNAALGVVIQAYLLVGDSIFKYLGKISEKEKSLIDEKIKRLPSDPHKSGSEILVKESAASKVVNENKIAPARKATSSPLLVKKEFSLDLDSIEAPSVKKSPLPQFDFDIDNKENSGKIFAEFNTEDPIRSISSLKLLEESISSSPKQFLSQSNEIVTDLTNCMQKILESKEKLTMNGARLGKHVINALVLIFSSVELSGSVKLESLHTCMSQVLSGLLDNALTDSDQGSNLSKMLNILMVRILQNGNSNILFSILLDILGKSSEKMLSITESELDTISKYTELVMKCSWKLIKTIPILIKERKIKIDLLLLDIHVFLNSYPPMEWKRRVTLKIPQTDMPLRTVKTILSMLIAEIGSDYLNHTQHIQDPNSHVLSYLRQMSESSAIKNKNNETKSTLQYRPARMTDADMAVRLNIIFDKIFNRDETKSGIQDLYQFKKTHPYSANTIEERLSQTGSYFQGYIRRGLSHLAEEEATIAEPDKAVSFAPMIPSDSLAKLSINSGEGSQKELNDSSLRTHVAPRTTDRSLAVAELKERLAKMKQTMNATS